MREHAKIVERFKVRAAEAQIACCEPAAKADCCTPETSDCGCGEGAATEVFAAVSPKAVPLAGNYLADSNVKKPRADAEDAALATRLWAESEKIVQAL